jgi:hypothetical protein
MARPTGAKQMQQRLEREKNTFLDRSAVGLHLFAEEVMGDSKDNYVPVDEGILKGTGVVSPIQRSGRSLRVTLAYGGPAAPYALKQHETEEFNHTVGEWKYLETPLMNAVGRMMPTIGKTARFR